MAVFLPCLVSDPSFTVLYVPLVHIQQYTILFNTKRGKYATCNTIAYLQFFCKARLKKIVGG